MPQESIAELSSSTMQNIEKSLGSLPWGMGTLTSATCQTASVPIKSSRRPSKPASCTEIALGQLENQHNFRALSKAKQGPANAVRRKGAMQHSRPKPALGVMVVEAKSNLRCAS